MSPQAGTSGPAPEPDGPVWLRLAGAPARCTMWRPPVVCSPQGLHHGVAAACQHCWLQPAWRVCWHQGGAGGGVESGVPWSQVGPSTFLAAHGRSQALLGGRVQGVCFALLVTLSWGPRWLPLGRPHTGEGGTPRGGPGKRGGGWHLIPGRLLRTPRAGESASGPTLLPPTSTVALQLTRVVS